MNNAKMWLVVPPAVGVPVFLGAVAVGSFAVHLAVLSKTNWYSDYLVGQELSGGEDVTASLLAQPEGDVAKASYAIQGTEPGQEVLIVLPDGTTAKAILQAPSLITASAPKVIDQ